MFVENNNIVKTLLRMKKFLFFYFFKMKFTFFSPRKGKGRLLKDYQDAEKQGMLHGKCDEVYSRYISGSQP